MESAAGRANRHSHQSGRNLVARGQAVHPRGPWCVFFPRSCGRDGDRYYLVTPQEKLAIDVEDAPFLAVDFVSRGEQANLEIGFRTNTDDVVFAGPGHRVWIEQDASGPRPYVHVRGGLNALIARSVYYPLMELAEEHGGRLWLCSGGERFDLGSAT